MSNFKVATEQEFKDFVENYPNTLEYDFVGVDGIPCGNYHDYSDGSQGADSVVASVMLYESLAAIPEYKNKKNEYKIKVSV